MKVLNKLIENIFSFKVSNFYEHFKFSSWKNPYNENEECCWKDKSTTPLKGRTYFWPIGNTVRMVTNIGNKDGGDEYLTSSFTKY